MLFQILNQIREMKKARDLHFTNLIRRKQGEENGGRFAYAYYTYQK